MGWGGVPCIQSVSGCKWDATLACREEGSQLWGQKEEVRSHPLGLSRCGCLCSCTHTIGNIPSVVLYGGEILFHMIFMVVQRWTVLGTRQCPLHTWAGCEDGAAVHSGSGRRCQPLRAAPGGRPPRAQAVHHAGEAGTGTPPQVNEHPQKSRRRNHISPKFASHAVVTDLHDEY